MPDEINTNPVSAESEEAQEDINALRQIRLDKLNELCEVMQVHPLTLLALAYAGDGPGKADKLLERVRQELNSVLEQELP